MLTIQTNYATKVLEITQMEEFLPFIIAFEFMESPKYLSL